MTDKTYAAPLYEGTFSVGLDKKFIPIGRNDSPAKGALKISINPFLISSPNRKILFDAGIGDFSESNSTDMIQGNLANHHIQPSDITDVFLSHLHFDHFGGVATHSDGDWHLTFQNAKLWVSQAGWNAILKKGNYYDGEKNNFFQFVNKNADLHLLEPDVHPYPEISTCTIGGHSQFSQLLLYQNGQQKYLMAGDVLATRGEVNRTFAAKYDFDGKKSMRLRKNLTRKAYEENFTVMTYHDSHDPLFKLTQYNEQQGYTIDPIKKNVSA